MTTFAVRQDRKGRVVYREIDDFKGKFQQVIRRGFFNYLESLQKRTSNEILHGTKTGRLYFHRDKAGRRRRHRSSAPGETHANLTGKLRRSLGWKVYGWETAEFGYGVSSNKANPAPVYGKYVEKGTKRMDARPSLANAVKAEPRDEHWDRAVDQEMRR